MSAIFGILRFDGQPASAAEVERMGATMPYRSPDRRRAEMLGPVGLGHGLMRVTHEDWNDAQPLRDKAADLTLVADVRLDNREALALALGIAAERLPNLADSALILAAYKHWGEDLVEHLLGDFAFGIWDGAAQKLVLARDHMGQRTLFYSRQAGFFAFATDLKALWAVEGVPRRLSDAAVARRLMLSAESPPGTTFYEDIFGLSGGERLIVHPHGHVVAHRYWRPKADPIHQGRDEAYYIATYRTLLAEAVACRLRRNLKPPALLISGGYDSSAIAALAGEVLRPQGRKLIGVSAVLAEGREDEPGNARRWVEACRRYMPHLDVRYFVRTKETVLTQIEENSVVTGGPSSENHFIRAALFEAAAAAGAQVAIDGHGGDYTVNPRGFGSLAYLIRTGRVFDVLPHALGEAKRREIPVWRVMLQALRQLIPPQIVAAKRWVARRGAPLWRNYPVNDALGRRMFAEGAVSYGTLRECPRDRSRMRAEILGVLNRQSNQANAAVPVSPATRGLEFTMPFHDKRLVEFGLAIPETLYAKGGCDRYLARRALADVLPPEVLARRWGANDTLDPDVFPMLEEIADQLRAAVETMASDPNLARRVDFDQVKLGLSIVRKQHKRPTGAALRAVLVAYYLRWFDQANDRAP